MDRSCPICKTHTLSNLVLIEQLYIVAIGFSAGGTQPLISFLNSTHHDHTAYILIRHVSIDYESQLHLILQCHSNLKLVKVTDA